MKKFTNEQMTAICRLALDMTLADGKVDLRDSEFSITIISNISPAGKWVRL